MFNLILAITWGNQTALLKTQKPELEIKPRLMGRDEARRLLRIARSIMKSVGFPVDSIVAALNFRHHPFTGHVGEQVVDVDDSRRAIVALNGPH